MQNIIVLFQPLLHEREEYYIILDQDTSFKY